MNNNHRITLNTNKNIIVEFTNERIIPASGLAVVGALLGKSGFIKKLNRMDVTSNRSQHQIKNGDIVLTYLGMLCMGKPYFEAVHEMDDDKDFYKTALANGLAPVDIDVTPMDNSKSKKEGVSRTYKGFDGYAPMMAYIGTEGYAINFELREGKQHCQKGTVEFLQETITLCHKLTDKPLLIRLDSGNDSIDNVAVLMDAGCFFIIKRNLRRESMDDWFEMAKQYFQNVNSPRDGKTVYIGSDWKTVTSKQFNKEFTLRTGYEITERTIDKYGQFNLVPDVEVETWWTNLGDPDEEIIRLYHAHGECEQFHSEVKTDMDLERLPSGKFATNALILELGMIAYNILRMIGQGTIGERAPRQKRNVKRRRLRTVISNLIMLAGYVTMHARQLIIGLGKSNVWRHIFSDICQKYAVTNA
nr:IS1380 family transposase [uncultured Bacteroides sp.]